MAYPSLNMSSDLDSDFQEELEVGLFAETTQHFRSYGEASMASCHWVDRGRQKVDPHKLELYYSRLKRSPAYGKVVGVGIRPKPTSEVVPCIRLDMDPHKGIHFNAVELSDSSAKLAAILEPTLHLRPGNMETLYLDYIKALQNRSAQFIWKWWLEGRPVH